MCTKCVPVLNTLLQIDRIHGLLNKLASGHNSFRFQSKNDWTSRPQGAKKSAQIDRQQTQISRNMQVGWKKSYHVLMSVKYVEEISVDPQLHFAFECENDQNSRLQGAQQKCTDGQTTNERVNNCAKLLDEKCL